jgi:ketosteroid isomerase-like protein
MTIASLRDGRDVSEKESKLSKSEAIRRYFAAYKAKTRKVVEDELAEDFTFTSPYDDAIDRATYFERCWPNSDRIKSIDIEKISESGNDVFVLYRVVNQDGDEFRNTELFSFERDRLRKIQVFFGATYRDGVFVKGK